MKKLSPDRIKALAMAHGVNEDVVDELCLTLQRWGWQPPDVDNTQQIPSTLVVYQPQTDTNKSISTTENTARLPSHASNPTNENSKASDEGTLQNSGRSSYIKDEERRSQFGILPEKEEGKNYLGRYELIEKVGQGGMGEIFRVRDTILNRELAMKCIHPKVAHIEEAVDQFITEAELTAQLLHPAIIPVHEVGRLENGDFYFIMPYVEGRTFNELIRARFKGNLHLLETKPKTIGGVQLETNPYSNEDSNSDARSFSNKQDVSQSSTPKSESPPDYNPDDVQTIVNESSVKILYEQNNYEAFAEENFDATQNHGAKKESSDKKTASERTSTEDIPQKTNIVHNEQSTSRSDSTTQRNVTGSPTLSEGQVQSNALHKLITYFHQLCRVVGYVHARSVLHCDLKPQNVIMGDFGELYLLDWGLARGYEQANAILPQIPIHQHDKSESSILGTPAYMSPEQVERKQLQPSSDVFSLGQILYRILSGRSPYKKRGMEVFHEVKNRIEFVFPEDVFIPEGLKEICQQCLKWDAKERYQDGLELAEAVEGWLNGSEKEKRANNLIEMAKDLSPDIERLREESQNYDQKSQEVLSALETWMPERQKWQGWQLQQQAQNLKEESRQLEIMQLQLLNAALTHDSDCIEAHNWLAESYMNKHRLAEQMGNIEDIEQNEAMMDFHNSAIPNGHPAKEQRIKYLQGQGFLTIMTEPYGAEVHLYKFVDEQRKLVPHFEDEIGYTPILEYPILRGSYLLILKHPKCEEVRYPIHIKRLEHWSGIAPNGDLPHVIHLPPKGSLSEDEVFIPAGYIKAGGDSSAPGGHEELHTWIDSFVMKRTSVTNEEYLLFLNDLLEQGREEEALEYAPQQRNLHKDTRHIIFGRDENNKFCLVPDDEGDMWGLDWPVTKVCWHSAQAYATWLSEKTKNPWRLPRELEWEKAGRGTDQRIYPWGNYFEPSRCCNQFSHPTRQIPVSVNEFDDDVSVYGVRGMCGNMTDWCAEPFVRTPIIVDNQLPDIKDLPIATERVCRGGAWLNSNTQLRLTRRLGNLAHARTYSLGFRVCYSWFSE